jgi:hypothetical protein
MNIKKNKTRWKLTVGFICFSTIFLTSLASAWRIPDLAERLDTVRESPGEYNKAPSNHQSSSQNELRLQSMLEAQKQKNLLLEEKIQLLEQELQNRQK